MLNNIKRLYLHRVFHGIRFKVNKGWSTAVLLFLCPCASAAPSYRRLKRQIDSLRLHFGRRNVFFSSFFLIQTTFYSLVYHLQ